LAEPTYCRTGAAGTVGALTLTPELPLTRSLPPRPAHASSDEPRDLTPDPTGPISPLRGSHALDQLLVVTDIEIMYAYRNCRWRCTQWITWGINRGYRLEHHPRRSVKSLDGPVVRGSVGLPDSLDHKRIITSGRGCVVGGGRRPVPPVGNFSSLIRSLPPGGTFRPRAGRPQPRRYGCRAVSMARCPFTSRSHARPWRTNATRCAGQAHIGNARRHRGGKSHEKDENGH
jgi:hypothetical protein